MNIIAVDDEQIALMGLVKSIRKVSEDCVLEGFRRPAEAVEYARKNPVDVAFLDIDMRGMTGLECARLLKEINPDINVVFTTGYSEYALEAFDLHVSGYVLKPVTADKIRKELANLRNVVSGDKPKKGLALRCFGTFEVFYDGVPVSFKYRRSKEMLAYLVDRRGAWVSSAELMDLLFDDPSGKSSYFKQLRKDLTDTLASVGAEDAIAKRRGEMCATFVDVSCDYIDWLEGKDLGNQFTGEYLAQYAWAEPTRATLKRD